VTSVRERARRWLLDLSLCLPFLLFGVIGTAGAATFQPGARAVDGLAYVLVAAAALSLAARRNPAVCLALNGLIVAVYLAVGYPFGPILLTVPAAVYAVAVRWPLPRASATVATDFAVLLVASFAKRVREPGSADIVDQMLWHTFAWGAVVAAALAVGAAVRVRRDSVGRVRTETALRVASEERLRMAQDLHDSIGHGLAVIAMQAGVALHVLDRDPDGARQAMEAVRVTSRESLENLRAELEALRRPGAAERRPAPGLGDLDRLTDRVRAGGVAVRVDLDFDLPAVPSDVSVAAYRIVQESLTNVLRHSGAAETRIRVRREDDALLVEVTDTGRGGSVEGAPVGAGNGVVRPGASESAAHGAGQGGGHRGAPGQGRGGGHGGAPAGASGGSPGTGQGGGQGGRQSGGEGGGHGIRGIRAQAEALGGTLHAGPNPAGGFVVEARLPLPGGKGR
jgi:signal transduction histidine kinase